MKRTVWILVALLGLSAGRLRGGEKTGKIDWQDWSEALFERAQKENRLVLLDLEAVWCHWCHVMDETTYQDDQVAEILKKGYIAVKVDQDSRPDLSNRYEDYGWPATILFSQSGRELAKLSGYIPPGRMASLLQAFLDDPAPGPSALASRKTEWVRGSSLSAELTAELKQTYFDHYDPVHGSWGTVHKFLHPDSVELAMELGAAGDERALRMARQTLDANLKLIDPVWGGVYQYSHGGVWENPHFEKIMSFQAGNLRIYAQAYARYKEPRYLETALQIRRYLLDFLRSPEGAFYTSQDADLKPGEHAERYFALDDDGRRALGIPRIDTHIYSRENGWAIEALATLSDVTSDPQHAEEAIRAAEWIERERSLPGGGFRHDAADAGGPYLGDTLAMGRALLSLHARTSDRKWLARAEAAARFMMENFQLSDAEGLLPGLVTARWDGRSMFRPEPQRDESIQAVRFLNLLHHYTGNDYYRTSARQAMSYLAMPDVARLRPTAGILLAASELAADPVHITVLGRKDDPLAERLHRAARRHPGGYKRVEWWDRREGPMPNPDVRYPELPEAAAFACAAGRCSRPISDPEKVSAIVERFGKS